MHYGLSLKVTTVLATQKKKRSMKRLLWQTPRKTEASMEFGSPSDILLLPEAPFDAMGAGIPFSRLRSADNVRCYCSTD
ncbi:MAG: hypothetical protein Ct9H300mP11_32640 [Chloroflexota bacterium]|nr:MAG: hypothetical protein Ct9H300mP11_32640 [Chloroflexota bacterium]